MIHPGQVCTTVDGYEVVEGMAQGVRSWGNSSDGETVLLTGVYLLEGEVTKRLLRALPRTIVLRADELDTPLISCSRRRSCAMLRRRKRSSTGSSTCC